MATLVQLATLFVSMVIQVVVPPLPAELIVIVAARSHGVWTTTAVAGSGLFAGSVLVYHLSRLLQHRLDAVFEREKVERVVERLRRWAVPILWIRILPYNPSDVISYGAGLIDVSPGRFYWITLCTSFLRCLALSVLGLRMQDLRTTFQVLGLLALSSLVAWALLYGRWKQRQAERPEPPDESPPEDIPPDDIPPNDIPPNDRAPDESLPR